MIGIYRITSPTKRVYIGQAVDIERRFALYKRLSCKQQPRLYASFMKYGYANHKFAIIIECDIEQLNDLERFFQELYNVLGKGGLNCMLTNSSDRSGELSEETKQKLSDVMKGKTNYLGKKHSEEHKRKLGGNKYAKK